MNTLQGIKTTTLAIGSVTTGRVVERWRYNESASYSCRHDEPQQIANHTERRQQHQRTSSTAQRRVKHVEQRGVRRRDERDLRAQTQVDDHEHEEHGPERRDGQARHRRRVDDVRQTGACNKQRNVHCALVSKNFQLIVFKANSPMALYNCYCETLSGNVSNRNTKLMRLEANDGENDNTGED